MGGGFSGSVTLCFFFSSRRRHTRCLSDWSSDVCSSDLVLVERLGARWIVGEQHVAVVVEVANQRNVTAGIAQPFLDLGHSRGGLGYVDRNTDQLGTRLGEFDALPGGRGDVGSIRVRHRLHDHGSPASHLDVPGLHSYRFMTLHDRHSSIILRSLVSPHSPARTQTHFSNRGRIIAASLRHTQTPTYPYLGAPMPTLLRHIMD